MQFAAAIYSACSGMYPQAYASLRTFLELGFAAIHFSANELDRRKWIANKRDFSWSNALDEDGGLLSREFVTEFNPQAVDEAAKWASSAAQRYRQCSEFIHGKHFVTVDLPKELSYSPKTTIEWLNCAKISALSLFYLIFIRYAHELLPNPDSDPLIEGLTSWFPDSAAVRETLAHTRPTEIQGR